MFREPKTRWHIMSIIFEINSSLKFLKIFKNLQKFKEKVNKSKIFFENLLIVRFCIKLGNQNN